MPGGSLKLTQKKSIAAIAREKVEGPLLDIGFSLWDVRYEKEGKDWNLVFELEKNGGVTFDDLGRANAVIDEIVEKADLIPGSYFLEVSSAGLTRLLRTPEHFAAAAKSGWQVEIKLFTPSDGAKSHAGKITFIGGDFIMLDSVKINKNNIAKARAVLG